MDQQVVEAELADARDLLDSTTSGHLGYTGNGGSPRVVMVGIWWTGTDFVVSTATTAPKVKALTANPEVALAIEAGGTPGDARALSIRGRAKITVVDGLVEEYVLAARKSMAPEAAAEFEENCRKMYEQMARIAIRPTWARYYDFGAGRMPGFLQDLAARSGFGA